MTKPKWFNKEIAVKNYKGFDITLSRYEEESDWEYRVCGTGERYGMDRWSLDLEAPERPKTLAQAKAAALAMVEELIESRKTCPCCEGKGHVWKDKDK